MPSAWPGGENVITVEVTAQNGDKKTCTVMVVSLGHHRHHRPPPLTEGSLTQSTALP